MFDRPLDCLADRASHSGSGPGSGPVRAVHPVSPESLGAIAARLGVAAWVEQSGFKAEPGSVCLFPRPAAGPAQGPDGLGGALLGIADPENSGSPILDPFAYAPLASALPAGIWTIETAGTDARDAATLGFSLGAYRFEAFRVAGGERPLLLAEPTGLGAAEARSVWLARDLINMPANRLGPRELAEAAFDVWRKFGGEAALVSGEELARGYPAIRAVGEGSIRQPVVFTGRWSGSKAGADQLLISLVGKGVCFDTGGYDLKPPAAMLRMKKDMGGAAIMLGLARLIMERDLPVRLELRIGCVENSVSGAAMRPSDVIATRKGLQVEIGNTDAEGRLVLCDLLAEASEKEPGLLLDAATLTGAARVALGPDLPALFSNDDGLARALLEGGVAGFDPLWRLPLHETYDSWLASTVADLNNVSSKPMAGAITAALFLQRFVPKTIPWAHIDTYAWSDSSRPGRPEGGDAQSLRAIFNGLLQMINFQRHKTSR